MPTFITPIWLWKLLNKCLREVPIWNQALKGYTISYKTLRRENCRKLINKIKNGTFKHAWYDIQWYCIHRRQSLKWCLQILFTFMINQIYIHLIKSRLVMFACVIRRWSISCETITIRTVGSIHIIYTYTHTCIKRYTRVHYPWN